MTRAKQRAFTLTAEIVQHYTKMSFGDGVKGTSKIFIYCI